MPVVRFAVEQRLTGKAPDYWDHATMLEISVLSDDTEGAKEHLANAVAMIRQTWEPVTTAYNLRIIERARAARQVETSRLSQVIEE